MKYDTFVNSLEDIPESKELELLVRDLTPGIHKYCYKCVKAYVSPVAAKFPDELQIRFGRGQAYEKPYSIQVLGEITKIPEKYL